MFNWEWPKRVDLFALGVQALISAIEIGSGINLAFVSHALISPAFPDAPSVAIGASAVFGLLFGLGGAALFAKRENAIKSIKAYAQANGESPAGRLAALWLVIAVLAGMGIVGLVYRVQFLSSRGISWLLWFGIFMEMLPILLSVILHPMKNKPVGLIKDEVTERFDREHVTAMYKAFEKMPLEIRHLAYIGDTQGALDQTANYMIAEDRKTRLAQSYAAKKEAQYHEQKQRKEIAPPKTQEHITEDLENRVEDVEDVPPFARPLREY